VELLAAPSLFLEQAYDIALDQPYRTRVLKFIVKQDCIEIENYLVKEEQRFCGGARNPKLLASLTLEDLELTCGCNMIVTWTGKSFRGVVEPGKSCRVNWRGQETYLDNEFEIDGETLLSLDRGRDLETDERVWGSIAGPFHFQRQQSFAAEVCLA
jgi:hypothetical protein